MRKITYCRLCMAQCGLVLDVEGGSVTSVLGDREHPRSRGYTCAKGRRIGDFASDPNRFRTAQRRNSFGALEAVETEVAIAEVGDALRRILDRHGPEAIAVWVGTQCFYTTLTLPTVLAFWRALGSHKYFTPLTIDQAPKWLAPLRLGSWLGGRQRFEESDVWVLAGINPLVSMLGGTFNGFPQQYGRLGLRDAKRRGLKILVIDPRRTETARLADLHLQIAPGTDAAVFAAMLHVILAEGLEDAEFCERWVDGLDELREAVAQATPSRVAVLAGVPADDIVAAARIFGSARKGMVSTGTGSNMGPFGNLNEHLAGCLNVVCGRFARAGDLATPQPALGPLSAPREGVAPPQRNWSSGYRSRVRGGPTDFCGELPVAILPDEIMEPGADRVRALLVLGGNPVTAMPDQDRAVEALSRLELLVAVEPFPTETAELAHYILPPALALERREHTATRTFDEPFAQFTDAVLEPPPGVREDWEYLTALARHLGLELELFGRAYPADDSPPTVDELLEASVEGSRVPLDDVKRHPHGRRYDELPPVRVAAGTDAGRFDVLPADVADELASALAEPVPASRPYSLVVRRSLEAINSLGRQLPGLTKRPFNACFMHPADLVTVGVASGGLVRLTSDYGSVAAVAEADPSMRRGAVSMTHAFGGLPGRDDDPRTSGTNPTRLLSAERELQAYTGMPRMTAVPVTVEALESSA